MPNAGFRLARIDQRDALIVRRAAIIAARVALIGACVGDIGHCCAVKARRAAKWHDFRGKQACALKRWAWRGDQEEQSEQHVHAR
jgi:hypothetical protein